MPGARMPAAVAAAALLVSSLTLAGSAAAAPAAAAAGPSQVIVIPPDTAQQTIQDTVFFAGRTGFLHWYQTDQGTGDVFRYLWTDDATETTTVVTALDGAFARPVSLHLNLKADRLF